jgi:predicted nucleic acid-binding Zn ribbon protein
VTRRRRAPRAAGGAVQALADTLAPQTLLADVQRAWPSAVGELVAAHATPTGDRGGTLVVTCDAAVWAQELDLMAPDLVSRLNAALGTDAVRGLRCQAVAPRSWGREG